MEPRSSAAPRASRTRARSRYSSRSTGDAVHRSVALHLLEDVAQEVVQRGAVDRGVEVVPLGLGAEAGEVHRPEHDHVLDAARDLLRDRHGIAHATLQVEPATHTGCHEVGW